MTRPVRIAVNMLPARDETGALKFHAALPMGALLEKSLDKQAVETARGALEQKYAALAADLRALRPHLRDGNVLRYWMFGDAIIAFEQATARDLLFVDKLSDHLARDVEYSKTMIDLARRLRKKFPDINALDPRISFDAYHRSGFDPQRTKTYKRAKSVTRPRVGHHPR